MKKATKLLLVIVLTMVIVLSMGIFAACDLVTIDYELNPDGESYTLSKLKICMSTELVIPSVYKGKPVTAIGYRALEARTTIKSIIIPDSVTSIGQEAFSNCSGLTSIVISGSVTDIGMYAFSNCSSLTSINIPSSVTHIGWWAFSNCSQLKYNEYDNGMYIGNENNPYLILVKASDKNIKSYKTHSNTKFIYDEAFKDCDNLLHIEIPNGIKGIGCKAFNCSNLQYNEFDSALYLGNVDNPYLVLVKSKDKSSINKKTKIIYDSAFSDRKDLTNIIIFNSVIGIENKAFYGCKNLETVYYKGTAEEWENISIGNQYNDKLTSATRYYYSEMKPTTSGNYWHYVNGEAVIWEN